MSEILFAAEISLLSAPTHNSPHAADSGCQFWSEEARVSGLIRQTAHGGELLGLWYSLPALSIRDACGSE